jgi:hypothetical protein
MDRLDALKRISFGARVAEDEINELARRFGEDQAYRQIAVRGCPLSPLP